MPPIHVACDNMFAIMFEEKCKSVFSITLIIIIANFG